VTLPTCFVLRARAGRQLAAWLLCDLAACYDLQRRATDLLARSVAFSNTPRVELGTGNVHEEAVHDGSQLAVVSAAVPLPGGRAFMFGSFADDGVLVCEREAH